MKSSNNYKSVEQITNILIIVELTRIANHLLAITTHAMNIGALSPFYELLNFVRQ